MNKLKLTYTGDFGNVFGMAWHLLFNPAVLRFDGFSLIENTFESAQVGMIEGNAGALACGVAMQGQNTLIGRVKFLEITFDIIGGGAANFDAENISVQDVEGNELANEFVNIEFSTEFINVVTYTIEEISEEI